MRERIPGYKEQKILGDRNATSETLQQREKNLRSACGGYS